MRKAELRKKYLEKRAALSKDEVVTFSEKIFQNFVLQFKPVENQSVHIFISISKFNEIDTNQFIKYFFDQNIRVFVPKMIGGKLISVELRPDSSMETNSWGISEPKSNEDAGFRNFDFVITPLLYCDSYGNRVGYGKGYYDQFFTEVSEKTKKIGVNFFTPTENIEDVSCTDIALDYLITADEVLSFGIGASNFTK